MFVPTERRCVNRIQKPLIRRHGHEEGILDVGRPMDQLESAGIHLQPVGVNGPFLPGREGGDKHQRLIRICPLNCSTQHHRTNHDWRQASHWGHPSFCRMIMGRIIEERQRAGQIMLAGRYSNAGPAIRSPRC